MHPWTWIKPLRFLDELCPSARIFASLLVLCLLPGCRPSPGGPLYLARGVRFELRAPAGGPAFFQSQDVRFQLPGGQEEQLITAVENDAVHTSVVASSPLGLTLFTLQLKDGQVTLDQRVPLPDRFDPRLLPALIQLANWPLEDLQQGLSPGAVLEEEGALRTLRLKGKIVLTLKREGEVPPYGKVSLEIPAHGIRAEITTLQE